jgi:hypothetical protein
MLYREIIAVCSEIHTKHINTLCGQNAEFLGAFTELLKATVSVVTSLSLPARNNSAPTGRTFMKFDIRVFFENLSRKFKFNKNPTITVGTCVQLW